MQLTKREKAIIVGTLLGDGCLERNGNHIRLRLEHGIAQESYVLWKFEALKRVVTAGSPMHVHAYHKNHNRYYDSLRVYTYSTPLLEEYWKDFYATGRKIVPENIKTLLQNPLSLAVWLMDDGYKRNDCNAFRFNTDMFSQKDQYRLCDTLRENFGIESTLHKKGKYWNVYVPQKSSRMLVKMIKRHILPDFQYKIALAP